MLGTDGEESYRQIKIQRRANLLDLRRKTEVRSTME